MPASNVYARVGKRALDIILSVIFLVMALPVILLVLLIASLDGHAPIYGHVRIGRRGRPFKCLKVRTMVPDAEKHLRRFLQDNPQAAEEWKQRQKLTYDPRITSIGRFLRITSLDELPQLWNVLRGDMSLVGPRPVTAEEILRYEDARHVVLSVRPGVTGAWQVSGRNRVGYDERILLDVDYVKSMSLGRDMKILLSTVPAVLTGTGA